MAELPPLIVSNEEVTARDERLLMSNPLGEGVDGYEDLRVTAAGAGLHVEVAAGIGYVRGDSITDQGLYRCRNDALKSSAAFATGSLAAAHSVSPRLDQIIARVYDHEADASGSRTWRLEVLTGTPHVTASLDSRASAAVLPSSAMLLADVLVPASATGLSSSDIRDRRPFSSLCIPPALTDVDMVPLLPILPGSLATNAGPSANGQRAYLAYLPRRIVGATRIRWATDSAVGSSTIAFGIHDASGRAIVGTGSVSANVSGRQSTAISATTFEAGMYYVWSGAGGTANQNLIGVALNAPYPNVLLTNGSGGTTEPATVLGYGDDSGGEVVPLLALSVG